MLRGARVEAPAGVLSAPLSVAISAGTLELPRGYVALSPAIAFRAQGEARASKLPAELRFELPLDLAKLPRGAQYSDVEVFRARPASGDVHAPPLPNLRVLETRGVVEFLAEELTTYRAAVRADAGERVLRRHTFRVMAGVSMGATGASSIGFRHHERFDVIAPLGGYVDWLYFAHFMEKYFLGGFCRAGEACRVGVDYLGNAPPELPMQPAQDFNNWLKNDNGGNFDRSDFIGFFQDFAAAFGNFTYYDPRGTYLPPGLERSYLSLSDDARCGGASPVRVPGVCNAEYNPDGRYTAIPVCDGEDGPPAGIYDPQKPHTKPSEVLLAFDVDGDGRRGYAEPVFSNARERFVDSGADGVPNAQEVGPLGAYDAQRNPDPAGDDYHWLYNPRGTENNWRWDPGERYGDHGLDGVPVGPMCSRDYGEGNGRYDVSPNLRRYLEHSPRTWIERLSPDALARLRVWVDGGIRDFAGSLLSGQQLVGALAGAGLNVKQWRSFHALLSEQQDFFDFQKVRDDKVGRYVLMTYGDPNATPEQIEDGDGKHIGTIEQALYRFLALFRFVDAALPGGDYRPADLGDATSARNETYFSPAVAVCRDPGSRACVVPSSRKSCAVDEQCETSERCLFGTCRNEPVGSRRSCSNDGQCAAGEMCLRPTCVKRPPACSTDAQCAAGLRCEARACTGDNNCENGERCVYGACRKSSGSQKQCAADRTCPGNEVCFGDRTYLVVLPPGYDAPENRDARYPVVYILHGYGQEPRDLAATVLLTSAFMATGGLQKMIFVYPDGKCYLGECKKANWYVDQPPGPDGVTKFAYEKSVLELIDHVDRTYRTKPEAMLEERR